MVVVPAFRPVIVPLLLMVATLVFEETHGLLEAAVADPVKRMVLPTATEEEPLMVGFGLTVKETEVVFLFVPQLSV